MRCCSREGKAREKDTIGNALDTLKSISIAEISEENIEIESGFTYG